MSLTMLAAQDQGLWKKNGIDVKWTPFRGGSDQDRAVAAGSIEVALGAVSGTILSIVRGVPQVIVADLHDTRYFHLWVKSDGPIKKMEDLKGKTVAVTKFGGSSHIFGQVMLKGVGLDKDVRLVAVGGVRAELAALKRGTVDGFVQTWPPVVRNILSGEFMELASAADYIPNKWVLHEAHARTDMIEKKPELVRKAVRIVIKAKNSKLKDRSWSKQKLVSFMGYPDKVSDYVVKRLKIAPGGQIDREAIQNVMNLNVEYGIIKKGEVPPMDKIYTNKFLQ
jgi:ABC-type nitrate/sulfonate/bicarbonate transport system substrate-binding protein